jgi:tetratricopeptide (TPR) repeat protein
MTGAIARDVRREKTMTRSEMVGELVLENEAAALIGPVRPSNALSGRLASSSLAVVPEKTQVQLLRMFANPSALEKEERLDLMRDLRECVKANPQVSDLRVLFGMALCVNFEVRDAIEELREGVRLAPDSFIAHLKMGELWMRLRVMEKAEEHTQRAARLASHLAQAELARRQGASIRAMKHAGVERGGYKSPLAIVTRIARKLRKRDAVEGIVPVHSL